MRYSTVLVLFATAVWALPSITQPTRDVSSRGFLPVDELGEVIDDTVFERRVLVVDEFGEPIAMEKRGQCQTNAECIQRGMPLLRPGRKLARQVTPSGAPQPIVSGRVRVQNINTGAVIGYISREFYSNVALAVTQNVATAAQIKFDPSISSTRLNIEINADAAFPYLCASVGPVSPTPDLGPGKFDYAIITACSTTSPLGSPPATTVGSRLTSSPASETAIFNYNAATTEITFQWINLDSSAPTTYGMYAPTGVGFMSLTGDVEEFRSAFGQNRVQIGYFFEKA